MADARRTVYVADDRGPAVEASVEDDAEPYRRVLDYVRAYRRSLSTRPHRPDANYAEMRSRLMAPLPEQGIDTAGMIDELIDRCDDGLMSIAGPRFFGWVMGGSDMRGVLADWLVSAWGQNTGYHMPTPAMAALEEVAESWLLELLDLPRESTIGFTTGATVANAVCLSAARGSVLRRIGHDPDADGLFGAPPVRVFVGDDAHSSVFSSLQLIGFGSARVTKVAADDQGRMIAEDLRKKIAETAGPAIVIAQAGQINTGAFDPFGEVIAVARAHGAWVHVDGAFGLWARAGASVAALTRGIEGADSWATDAHKWLQAPFDCGLAIVRDRESHLRAMTNWASYLPVFGPEDRIPSALVPELSRRARGAPVWAMIRVLGRAGVSELVDRHCMLARQMAGLLGSEPGVRILNDVVLNQVIVNFGTGDRDNRKAMTEAVIARVQQEGKCFVGGAAWRDDWVMRISVSSGATEEPDIQIAAESILAAWRSVREQFRAG
jgi:glutamate/tyrosine decarboxylase-like PLP-dependent enzyme